MAGVISGRTRTLLLFDHPSWLYGVHPVPGLPHLLELRADQELSRIFVHVRPVGNTGSSTVMQETAKDSPLGELARPFRQPNRWYKGQIAHCLCGFSADVAKQWNVVASTTGTKPRLQLPDGEEHRCTKAQLIRRKRGPRPKPPRPPTASLSLTFPAVDLEKMRALHGDHLNKQAARIVARVLLGKESEPCPLCGPNVSVSCRECEEP